MHNYKRLKTISRGPKALTIALASSLCMLSTAYATGLGRLTVLSSLGQPLRAEIELTSPNKEEVSALVPKLASVEAFKQANIDFNSALLSLRFAVEQRGARYVIRVTSNQPINEPFVDLLLEMNSSSGRLFREYTFLLDPAELRTGQSAQVTNPVSVGNVPDTAAQAVSSEGGSAAQAAVSTKKNSNIAKPAVVPVRSEAQNKSGTTYEVKRGDTLSKVANAYRSDSVSLDQMLVSLYKANPQAFDRSNMNRLKAGQILSIPDSDNSQSISKGEARAVVLAHAADFNAYRNKLAGQVENAPATKSTQAKQTASGNITAKVNEAPSATNEAVDRLKLSKAASDASATSAKPGTGKNQADEDKIAREKAVAEANARVKELEKNVSDLQKILEVKNKDLANKQAAAETKPAPVSKEVAPASAAVAASASTKPEVAASAPASAPDAVLKPPVKRKPVAPPPPPPEPGFFDSILEIIANSAYVLWTAVAVALIAVSGIFNSRRKKKLQQFDDSILTGSSMKANSMFGSTGGQSVDTNNSVFNSNFAPSASQLDANEVDPVAEADVYIAYGRDSQAEEILKEALRTQPERHAVRVKLLEIYHSRKDPRSFERLASELYGMTNGVGEEWSQAASMGLALEPANPLYAGGKPLVNTSEYGGLGATTQPLDDLDSDSLLDSALSEDMLDSISIIDTAAALDDEPVTAETEMKAEPVAQKHEAEAEAEVFDIGSLDFDLGTPDLETSTTAAPTSPAVAELAPPMLPVEETSLGLVDESAVTASDANDIDFNSIDFDLGDAVVHLDEDKAGSGSSSGSSEAHAPLVEPTMPAVMQDTNHLPAMDFTSEHAQHEEQQPEVSKELAIDLTLSEEPTPMAQDNAESAESVDHEFGDLDKGMQDVDADMQHEAKPSDALASNFDFDLSGIDLDLDSPATDVASQEAAKVEETPAFNAEMATKLDLAVAYHEIGDKEGARELLDEVIKGGTVDQIERARNMLAQLA
ncbi:MAG: LysM peptidoglycan-binding domain-containing protein [Burkholderiaceae bacterium]|nr:LysM peptidoglycan-binding domain-containing protein [Burkholderiaceae bacterium]